MTRRLLAAVQAEGLGIDGAAAQTEGQERRQEGERRGPRWWESTWAGLREPRRDLASGIARQTWLAEATR